MNSEADYRLLLLDISYFSGKVEAYLRYKGVAYQREDISWRRFAREVLPEVGLMKVPVVATPDGQWLKDSTPIMDWFEQRQPEPSVLPDDPVARLLARLLEDYADEWLWRPALHYRWSYRPDALLYSRRIVAESLADQPAPQWLLRANLRRRQRREYVRGDGVTRATRAHVEAVYLDTLDRLQALLSRWPFISGERPSLADFGFFASMFRHFSIDPTPSRIMRERAPAVYQWTARLWAAPGSELGQAAWPGVDELADRWLPLLRDMGSGYLDYLHANAVALGRGERWFDWNCGGVVYRGLPVVRYRAWCRERLQQHYHALGEGDRARADLVLEGAGVLEPLLRDGALASGIDLPAGGEAAVCRPPYKLGLGERFALGWPAWNRD